MKEESTSKKKARGKMKISLKNLKKKQGLKISKNNT